MNLVEKKICQFLLHHLTLACPKNSFYARTEYLARDLSNASRVKKTIYNVHFTFLTSFDFYFLTHTIIGTYMGIHVIPTNRQVKLSVFLHPRTIPHNVLKTRPPYPYIHYTAVKSLLTDTSK